MSSNISSFSKIKMYNSDTGNRDLGTEKSFDTDVLFEDVLKIALKLKAFLIVRTSTGRWYIKGIPYVKGDKIGTRKVSFEDIENMLDRNSAEGKHSVRTSWLIKY